MKTSLGFLNKVEKKVVMAFAKELKDKFGDDIITIKLFGSKVRGDFNKDSDIDLFILVRIRKKGVLRNKISDIAADYIYDYDIPLANVVYSKYEYEKNKELGSFFTENVEKEAIEL